MARCIQSVPFAQEIIVLDSASKDKTQIIAKSFGARVIDQSFLGYREQKQKALSFATQEWVLSLDADEALSPQLQEEIKKTVGNNGPEDGYRMPRCSFHLNRWIKHGGWYPDYQTRLFRRLKGKWVGGEVHEYVQIDGVVGSLKSDLHHYVFKNLEEQINTNNQFSSLGCIELVRRNQRFSMFRLIFRPLWKFIECYLWKGGLLDGPPGLIIALGASQSLFLKYAKLWERKFDSVETN